VAAPAPLQTFAVKKWVKQALTDNGKPVRVKMHVKSGDTVVVTAGKDKGKVSTVDQVLTKTGKLIVKDVNMMVRFTRLRSL
jgi:large subunit ribosomal protein L24